MCNFTMFIKQKINYFNSIILRKIKKMMRKVKKLKRVFFFFFCLNFFLHFFFRTNITIRQNNQKYYRNYSKQALSNTRQDYCIISNTNCNLWSGEWWKHVITR